MKDVVTKNEIWEKSLRLFNLGIDNAMIFIQSEKYKACKNMAPTKIEFAVGSRYLHRGFYCPSLLFELVVVNARRGRILSKRNKKSRITHQYYYNFDTLYMVEYYTNLEITAREYIERNERIKFGYVFNVDGLLAGVSVELYNNEGNLESYLWAICHNASPNAQEWVADYLRFEEYQYTEHLSTYSLYFVALDSEEYKIKGAADLVYEEHYRVEIVDGKKYIKKLGSKQ